MSSEPLDQTIEDIREGQGEHSSYAYHQEVDHSRVKAVTILAQKKAVISRYKRVKVVKITKIDRAKVKEVTPVVGPN